jgi:hypothetical protein
MKRLFTCLLTSLCMLGNSQIANFESLTLAPDTFWYATDVTTDSFSSEGMVFPSRWSNDFGGYWDGGFAYSNMTDTVTSGYLNAFSSKAGHGFNMSANYVVAYGDGWFRFDNANGVSGVSMYLNNNTFAYNSMRDGDGIGKKFGGTSGTDPDYFTVTFQGYLNGEQAGGALTFYLADFRFENNADDYILKTWTQANLSAMGTVDSVTYFFSSSDEGNFGINTPTYFCADRIAYTEILSIENQPNLEVRVYPNPSSDVVNLEVDGVLKTTYEVLSLDGKLIEEGEFIGKAGINVSGINAGTYMIRLKQGEKTRIVRQVVR